MSEEQEKNARGASSSGDRGPEANAESADPDSPEAPREADGAGTSGDASHMRHEGATAFRSALKLGVSLMLTWSVALIVTFKLPKYFGPLKNGYYQFCDSFTGTLFVFIGLGVDTYIQREVPVRPKHASDFFGGFVLARLLLSVPLFAIGAGILLYRAKPTEVLATAALFGLVQIFMTLNETFAKMLQASTKVGGLAIANVLAKILWGGGAYALVVLKAPLVAFAVPVLLAEVLKAAFLFSATRKAVELELRVDVAATKAVLKESFPFFVSAIAVTMGSKLDVTMLDFVNPGVEVGWYGAARQIANLSMLLAPIVSGVLIPMMRRAHERSEEEFFEILRRCLEGVSIVSIPVTTMLALGADVWIKLALKDEFLPAAVSLRLLAPTFVFAYGNVLLWLALMILGRSWTITLVSIGGLIALPLFILLAVPLTRDLGAGGAGMGVGLALSLRELGVILVFLYFLGKRATDRRSILAVVKSLAVAGAVTALHLALARLGPVRLAIDTVAYLVLGVALGIYRPRDAIMVLKLVKNRGR